MSAHLNHLGAQLQVRQELKSKFPEADIKVGYVSTGMKMKPT